MKKSQNKQWTASKESFGEADEQFKRRSSNNLSNANKFVKGTLNQRSGSNELV